MSTSFGNNHLQPVDYLVIGGCLLISLLIGIFQQVKSRRLHNKAGRTGGNEELLAGSRNLSILPVAVSAAVSSYTALVILAFPAEVYAFGLQFYWLILVAPVGTPISMYLFMEVLYNLKLTSVFQYLEIRFNSVAVRYLLSVVYILQDIVNTGIVIYAPALALETIVGLPVWLSVTGITTCCIIYTGLGGLRAVVWSDVFQLALVMAGLGAILIRGISVAGGISAVFQIADERGRLVMFDWTVDPFMRHNALNLMIGFGTAQLYVAIKQQLVQRFCSLPSLKEAVVSLLWSMFFSIVPLSLCFLIGIVIFAVYAACDPLTTGRISSLDQIAPYFVIQELAFIPGMLGLFTAAMFSAELSTISTVMNSVAAVTWEDYLAKLRPFRNADGAVQAATYKILVVIYGGVIIGLALNAKNMGSVLQASISVMNGATGIQGAVFVIGMFLPFVNKFGVIAGTMAGVGVVGTLSVKSFLLQQKYIFQTPLPFGTDGCPNELLLQRFGTTPAALTKKLTMLPISELYARLHIYHVEICVIYYCREWPEKLFTISYALYPFIGSLVTIGVAIIVSLFTGGKESGKSVKPEYLHSLIRPNKKATKA